MDEWFDLLDRSKADRIQRAMTGKSDMVERGEILLPDRQSRRPSPPRSAQNNPNAVMTIPVEYIDDTLGFNPRVGRRQDRPPAPVLFITSDQDRLVPPEESEQLYAHAGEPKKLVTLKGVGHYEVYEEPAFSQVMHHTLKLVPATHARQMLGGVRLIPSPSGRGLG